MALGYLISPALQVEDESGKPLVGGTVVVYRHGTTIPYITWKNFNGDRNPARVELDALGMCILLADDALLYDVYCYDRNGVQQWSRLNVSATTGGGGGVEPGEEMSVLRCDATDLTQSGPFVFESLSQDGEGAYVDSQGHVRLAQGTWHYDITVEVDYSPVSGSASTTNLVLSTLLNRSCLDFDLSYAHTGTLRLSGLVNVTDDGTVFGVGMGGMATGMTASVVDFGIFEVVAAGGESWQYYEPGQGITIDGNVIKVDTSEIQEKLVAGQGITIDENNVISASGSFAQVQADWTENSSSSPAYIKHRPDLSQYATNQELTAGLSAKQDTIPDLATIRAGAQAGSTAVQPGDLSSYATDAELTAGLSTKQDTINDLSSIRSGASAGSTAVQPADLATVATTGDYDDLINKPTIPTKTSDLTNDSGFITDADAPVKDVQVGGISVVNAQGIAKISIPASGVLDVEVDGTSVVNTQGVAEIDLSGYATTQDLSDGLADKQDVLTPGSNITITNNVISATASPQQQADWDQGDSSAVDYIRNKPTIPVVPTMKELVAGSNVTITESANSVTISADGAAQVQSDWAQNNPEVPSYIQNKPAIPVLPTMKELVAGSGVMITEGSTDVTISATGATYTAGTGIDITNGVISADTTVLALKSELPAIGTITL